jgi:lactate dehydrogenase-like 2-hydroxyacid dehydrogenase
MAELFDVTLRDSDAPMSRDELIAAMQDVDVLVPTVNDRLDAAVFEQASERLKLVANYGAGTDHIDVNAAHMSGIMVSNTPGVGAEDTADMTLALMLSVTRRIPEGLSVMQTGDWDGWSPTALLGGKIGGRALGILGMGRIGQAVAQRARAFGMQVHYHNRNRLRPETEADIGAKYWSSLNQMLPQVDILTIHCPHTPSTYHIMNARRLALMKPSAVIVNTSRGDVIDENALTRMLRSSEIAGAGLDVYEGGAEPNPRLRALKNVVLLPHMASATVEGRAEMGARVMLNISTHADGIRPPDMVIPSSL